MCVNWAYWHILSKICERVDTINLLIFTLNFYGEEMFKNEGYTGI